MCNTLKTANLAIKSDGETIILKPKKSKIIRVYIALFFLPIIGVGGFWSAHLQTHHSVAYIKICSLFIILLSPFLLYQFSKFIIQHKPSFVLAPEGIYDNQDTASAAFVKWHDINYLEVINIYKPQFGKQQQLLLIYIFNPKDYISQCKGIRKFSMSIDYKKYGTPIFMSSYLLGVSCEELKNLILSQLFKYRKLNDT